ncbi:MAG: acetylglutamate kinase [Eubacterium sp.]|nr:acetylglutamate kinase [Candidatus Colimonas fimequi]
MIFKDRDMQENMKKAEVLIEALPYIRRFNRRVIVVKYGGSAMIDEELKKSVIEDVVLLKLVGFKPVIVHGGGKEISKWINKVGMETEFIDGFRKTDEATMELAEMVLGKVNKDLVTNVQMLGVRAAGISGKDGGMFKVEKKMPGGKDIGFVGDIVDVDTKIIRDLIKKDFLPIVFPVGMDDEGNTYNINADEAASAIAEALEAEKLVYLSDVEGVRLNPEDPESVISELKCSEALKLIDDGIISGGMLPKVMNCIKAIENGVSRIHIMDGRIPHSLLLEIFTNKGIGTLIETDEEEAFDYGQDSDPKLR